jgi:hypothetical protein
MFRLVLLLLFSIIGELVNSSSILVKDGVYSRVTVQIQDQPQPSNCVDFLDHLEVREKFIFLLVSFLVFLGIGDFYALSM